MAVKRYTADADNTITNAYEPNLMTLGEKANMGASDSMEVFTIWSQRSSSDAGSSLERSRALVQFPVADIIADRTTGDIPGSGSVNFILKIFNAEHPYTLPINYDMAILPISQSWSEGYGLDMETYQDHGESNWLSRSLNTAWGTSGGTFHTESAHLKANDAAMNTNNIKTMYKVSFGDSGTEDIEIDISELVEQWIAGTKTNYGVGLMMSGAYETDQLSASFYTKKFYTRTSEYFYKRPHIEARWDDSKKDDRANFYASSPLASNADNQNTLFLYNQVRGQLKNIPNLHASNTLTVRLYRDSLTDLGLAATARITALSKTAGAANTRVLTIHDAEGQSVSFAIDNSISTSTATKIAFSNANSNATQFATNIAAAINAADTAGTLNISATSADAIVTLTMNTLGSAGNSVSNIAGTAVTDSVVTVSDQFSGGGVTEVIGGLTDDVGVYTASFTIDTTASILYDVWSTGSTELHTGSAITVKSLTAEQENPNPKYVTSMTNLRAAYSNEETARFRLFIRKQNWSPTIYTKATETLNSEIIDSAYFKITRLSDNLEVIPFGTGSTNHTKLSYDQSGSYFDLDMSMLEQDYAYGLSFAYHINGKYVEQPEVFKFRIEE